MMSGSSATPAHERATEASEERPARRRFRFREYTIGPDRRPEAVPVTFAMFCGTCGAISPITKSGDDGVAWALEHLKIYPQHLDYREHITRPYRAEAGAWL